MTQRRSTILERGIAAVGGPLLAFSLYLLLAGHNRPGGGFAGGLVAGTAIVVAWAAGGAETVGRLVRFSPTTLLGVGLLVAGLTGLAPLLLGAGFLESASVEIDLPLVGHVKAVSALAFDVGVYLVVVGVIHTIVLVLGEPEER